MFVINCPWCGERDLSEFAYGGEAHIVRPTKSETMSDAEWDALTQEITKAIGQTYL